jgi:uncharacterized peroxidase-related enzyme
MTARLPLIDPARASGQQKELLDAVRAKMGLVPNMTRALANSPAALRGYLDFSGALAGTSLSARQREQLALAVAEVNACGYCLSAHALIGGKLGLKEAQVLDARRGLADDMKTEALLRLAQRIVLERGHVKDADLRAAREAGVTDGELAETVAVVALNLFTNYFNHVADTPVDFPEVKPGVPAAVASGSACTDGGCA